MTLEELFTTYWAQAVAIGSFLAFIAGRIFDLRENRIAHKQELFQERRIDVIMDFMSSYDKLQMIYRRIIISNANITSSDFEAIKECNEQLYSSYFFLRLFLDPLEQSRYSDLMISMNSLMTNIHTGNTEGLQQLINKALNENNENFKVITEMFRGNSLKHRPIKM